MLGLLQENAAPRWSHVPHADSPVIDRGVCASATDQRGAPRPVDGDGDSVALCDLGAVEYVPSCDDPEGAHDCRFVTGGEEAEMEQVSP